MKTFVVDTNIIFSVLLKNGPIRTLLLLSPFKFITVDKAVEEIIKHQKIILEKSRLNEKEFRKLFSIIMSEIYVSKIENYIEYLGEAEEIMKEIDRDDSPFIALALSFENDGIWSEDKHFGMQNRIRILKTKDLLELVNREI